MLAPAPAGSSSWPQRLCASRCSKANRAMNNTAMTGKTHQFGSSLSMLTGAVNIASKGSPAIVTRLKAHARMSTLSAVREPNSTRTGAKSVTVRGSGAAYSRARSRPTSNASRPAASESKVGIQPSRDASAASQWLSHNSSASVWRPTTTAEEHCVMRPAAPTTATTAQLTASGLR